MWGALFLGDLLNPGNLSPSERPINAFVYSLSEALLRLVDVIGSYGMFVIYYLVLIEVIIFGLYIAGGKHNDLASMIEKFVILALIAAVAMNLDNLAYIFVAGLHYVVTIAVSPAGAEDAFLDPSYIFYLFDPVLEAKAASLMQLRILTSAPQMIIQAISLLVLMLAVTILFLQMLVAMVEFFLVLALGMVLFPFSIVKPTQFIGGKVLSAVVGQSIHWAATALLVNLLSLVYFGFYSYFTDITTGSFQLITMTIFVDVFVIFMAIKGPSFSKALLTGVPNLSPNGFAYTIMSMTRTAGAAVKVGAAAATGGGLGLAATGALGGTLQAAAKSPSAQALFRTSPVARGAGYVAGAASGQMARGATAVGKAVVSDIRSGGVGSHLNLNNNVKLQTGGSGASGGGLGGSGGGGGAPVSNGGISAKPVSNADINGGKSALHNTTASPTTKTNTQRSMS